MHIPTILSPITAAGVPGISALPQSVELDGSSLDGDRSGPLDRHLGALNFELGGRLELEVGSGLQLHVRIGGDLDVPRALDGHLAAAGDLVCRLLLEKKNKELAYTPPHLPLPATQTP